MGIPLLYPWANRLSANTYRRRRRSRRHSTPGAAGCAPTSNGLPIHGAARGVPRLADDRAVRDELIAELDFGGTPELLASFPFPHLLEVDGDAGRPHADRRAPWSRRPPQRRCRCASASTPTCSCPGCRAGSGRCETPAMRHLAVDGRGLPTGASSRAAGRLRSVGRQGVRRRLRRGGRRRGVRRLRRRPAHRGAFSIRDIRRRRSSRRPPTT